MNLVILFIMRLVPQGKGSPGAARWLFWLLALSCATPVLNVARPDSGRPVLGAKHAQVPADRLAFFSSESNEEEDEFEHISVLGFSATGPGANPKPITYAGIVSQPEVALAALVHLTPDSRGPPFAA